MSKRVYTRSRSNRTGDTDEAEGSGRRRSSRRHQEDDDDEEPVESLSRSSKGSGSRKRTAETEVEEAEEDNEEGDEEEVEADTNEPETDGGLWGLAPIKKMKVSVTAKKAAEVIGAEEVKRQANDLARLALFCEHKRVALKREDITKKVLDKTSSKAFPVIFNRAQKVLQYTFGYEMIELRLRGMDNEQLTQANASNGQEEGEGGGDKTQVKSKTYILRSVFPAKLIAKMATPNASMAAAVNNGNESTTGGDFDSEGVIVDWKRSGSELGNMGLLYLVLSLILLNGRSISDDQLRSYLKRMSLDPLSILPHALQPECTIGFGQEGKMTMEDYLEMLIKQSYLECSKSGAASQGAMSMDAASLGRRVQTKGRKSRTEEGRATGEGQEWRWGARAESEVTEKAVGEFVADVFINSHKGGRSNGNVADVENDDDDQGADGDGDEKTRESILQHVEHAAGSGLIS